VLQKGRYWRLRRRFRLRGVAAMKLKSLFLLLPATVVWMADPALAGDAVTFYDTQAAIAAVQNATLPCSR